MGRGALAHLGCEVVAGATVVVLVQHLGDITAVKLVACQADRLALGTERGWHPQRYCHSPGTPPANPSPATGDRAGLVTPWGHCHCPGTVPLLPLPCCLPRGSSWHIPRARGQHRLQPAQGPGGPAVPCPRRAAPAALAHPALHGAAAVPALCPLAAGRLHQADPQLDERARGVLLGGHGDTPQPWRHTGGHRVPLRARGSDEGGGCGQGRGQSDPDSSQSPG